MTSLYDQLNGWGPDYDYWLALARKLHPKSVVDLGCGTGQLTVLFARDGYELTGVDPDPEMLLTARSRPGHELVRWIDGYASEIPTSSADLVTMTSHVSQVFLTEAEWSDALTEIHRALRPGGRVVFDMRNPEFRGWEEWNPLSSLRSLLTPDGPAETWYEVTSVVDGLVTFKSTIKLIENGRTDVVEDVLRFRDESSLRTSLALAGFDIEDLHGDWDGSPATRNSRELIVTAVRTTPLP
jgi:SAM-dependent methyltransferase